MLSQSIPLIHTGDSPLGWMESKEWEGTQRILFEQGILSRPIGSELVYTTKFLEKIYSEEEEEEEVNVKLSWLHQNQFVGFYAADQLGYYGAEGLKVDLHSAGYDASIEDRVINGDDQFGVTIPIDLLKKISSGAKLKAIAAVYYKNPTVFLSLKEKNILSLKDLE